ncbi:hypothetical protein, partial [Micrococcus luteus]|uniref:hypothetical protein n=1 Tax=Micrococcus luteus TaxID=1270 RepID=UPI0010AE774D
MVRLVVRAPRRGAVVRRRVHHARGPGRRTGAFASGVVGAFLEQTAAEHPFDDGSAHEARVLERDVVVAGDFVLPPHPGRRRGGGAGVEDLLDRFRDLVIARALPEEAGAILHGMPEDQVRRLSAQAAQ